MNAPANPESFETHILRPAWTIGVLGHRTLGKPLDIEALLESEMRKLVAAAAKLGGELHVQTSADAGTDLLMIRVARRLGLTVHLLLPLEEGQFLSGFGAHSHAVEEARAAIARARLNRNGDSVDVALTTGSRPECYFDTDARILETSDLVITVWDGEATTKLGGTGQVAALSRALLKPSITVHPTTLAVSYEHFQHGSWPEPDPHWNWMVENGIFSGATSAGVSTDLEQSNTIKSRLSARAKRDAFDFRRSALSLIVIGATTGIVGLLAGVLPPSAPRLLAPSLYGLQLVLAAWVLYIRWLRKRHTLVTQWTNARLGAEIWRGLSASLPMAYPLRPIAASLMPEWKRFAVSLGLLINRYRQPLFAGNAEGLDAFKREYVGKRLRDQRAYFERESEKSFRWARYCPAIAARCSQVMPVFSMLALINRMFGFSWTVSMTGILAFTVLPAVLPITASVADGMVSTFDHRRRSNRFRHTIRALTLLESEVPHLRTEDTVRSLVRRTEELLLSEQSEWRSATTKLGG